MPDKQTPYKTKFDPSGYIRTVKYTNSKTGEVTERKILDTAPRLAWFRSDYPIESGWQILTEMIGGIDQGALVKATIVSPTGVTVAMAYRQVLKTAFANYIEKAETQAIGRALERCGYGCAYALSLEPEEGEGEADEAGGAMTKTEAQPRVAEAVKAPTSPASNGKLTPIDGTSHGGWWATLVKNAGAHGYKNHQHVINALASEKYDLVAMDYEHRGDILELLRMRHEREHAAEVARDNEAPTGEETQP